MTRSSGRKPPIRSVLITTVAVVVIAGVGYEFFFSKAATPAVTTLETATHTVCVSPQPSAQNVKLPTTGGVSVTIDFGTFPSGTSGCDEVKVATGSDVEAVHPTIATSAFVKGAQFVLTADSVSHPPLLTVSVGEGLDGNPVFGSEAVVTGMTLKSSPDINFPDGTYYATITTTSGQTSTLNPVIAFTAKNGVLRVAAIPLANGRAFPIVVFANTSSILAIYPKGVLPTVDTIPGSTSTTTPTSSTVPGSTTIPTEPPHQNPMKGAFGQPPPNGGTIGSETYYWTSGCAGNPGCSQIDRPLQQQNGGADIQVPGGMSGTINYATDISYMGIFTVKTMNCPVDWTINAGLSGSGSISIPASDPFGAQSGLNPCTIEYSTLPPGRQGTYYTEDFIITGFDIGAH